ncbi:MAG: hypothetical protein NTY47_07640, partial [Candidatus Omnitrophica bacterium]|nr:hypothetical protein [Candidatus Omnitrophota bacterium]
KAMKLVPSQDNNASVAHLGLCGFALTSLSSIPMAQAIAAAVSIVIIILFFRHARRGFYDIVIPLALMLASAFFSYFSSTITVLEAILGGIATGGVLIACYYMGIIIMDSFIKPAKKGRFYDLSSSAIVLSMFSQSDGLKQAVLPMLDYLPQLCWLGLLGIILAVSRASDSSIDKMPTEFNPKSGIACC